MSRIEDQICARIQERAQVGLEKYGVSLADSPESMHAWINHAQMEALDFANYLEKLREVALALQAAKSAVLVNRELAWLIEAPSNPFRRPGYLALLWISGAHPRESGIINQRRIEFNPDHNFALRFARKCDAIDFMVLHADVCAGCVPTEHEWLPEPAPSVETNGCAVSMPVAQERTAPATSNGPPHLWDNYEGPKPSGHAQGRQQ